ncbi:MAG TPA: glycosyltransferase [Candidatus Limnocylindria bacterium]|nr:glycosyltransferase [Candidatus Limnocylindria bacterium]
MKVAHLDTGRTWRGGQAQVLFLMRGLRAHGDHNLLLAPEGPLLERARAEGFATERWRPRGELDLGAVWRAARRLAAADVDVAHCHSAHAHAVGVPAARLAKVPAVLVSRRVDFAVARHPFSALKYRMPVDRYLCISRGVLAVMRAAGVPESRLALVPSGIELPDPPLGQDLRALIGAPEHAPIVGTVAALAPHKDHANLLAAVPEVIRRVPDVQFVWVGEGECRLALERARAALGLESRVHLLGFRADAHAMLRQFTVFALASYLEGLCTSLLDAQALGVAIVATAVGGVPDVVRDGVTGRLVPARQPHALAEALVEALEDPSRRAGWAARARDAVQAFRIERTVELTRAEYQRALGVVQWTGTEPAER